MLDPRVVEAAYDDAVESDTYKHKTPVTMPMIGGCRRQAAYALDRGWPDESSPSSAAAYHGSAIHNLLLPDLALRFGADPLHDVEVEVVLHIGGLTISGHVDLRLPEGEVLDLKTVSHWYYPVVRSAVPWHNKLQVTGYALATDSIGCTLLYVNRSGTDPEELRFAVSFEADQYLPDLEQWVADVQHPPESVPRDERGPGLSMICDSCAFVKDCWGWEADLRAPQTVVVGELGIEAALEEYDAARALESTGKLDKKFWRAALDSYERGDYGDWSLGWSGGRPGQPVVDVDEAVQLLQDFGLPIPYKESPPVKPSIRVTRRKNPT